MPRTLLPTSAIALWDGFLDNLDALSQAALIVQEHAVSTDDAVTTQRIGLLRENLTNTYALAWVLADKAIEDAPAELHGIRIHW